jgi:hypothetical protein
MSETQRKYILRDTSPRLTITYKGGIYNLVSRDGISPPVWYDKFSLKVEDPALLSELDKTQDGQKPRPNPVLEQAYKKIRIRHKSPPGPSGAVNAHDVAARKRSSHKDKRERLLYLKLIVKHDIRGAYHGNLPFDPYTSERGEISRTLKGLESRYPRIMEREYKDLNPQAKRNDLLKVLEELKQELEIEKSVPVTRSDRIPSPVSSSAGPPEGKAPSYGGESYPQQ